MANSIDVTLASKHVEANSQEIIVSGLQSGSETAAHLISTGNVQFGVKGETAILKMDADVNLQENDNCGGRSALGSIKFSDAKIKTNGIKDIKDICSKSFYNTYFAFQALNKGAYNGTELNEKFMDYIMEFRAKKIAGTIEKVYWQGDTASANLNLKRFNGVLKIVGGTPTATPTDDIIAKLQFIVNSTNVDLMSNEDFTVYIGQDTMNKYRMALANRNIFQVVNEETIFGSNVRLMVVSGLNGTTRAVATRTSNLQLALDGEGDMDKAIFDYDRTSEMYRQDFYFATGIGIVYPAEIAVYNLTDVPAED